MYQKAVDATPVSSEPVIRHAEAGYEFQLGTAYEGLAGEFPARPANIFPKPRRRTAGPSNYFPHTKSRVRTWRPCWSISGDIPRRSSNAGRCSTKSRIVRRHMNLGRAFYAQGQLDSALTEYQSALDLDPQSSNAMASIGGILAQTGQIDRGIVMLQEALKIDPNNTIARQNLLAAMAKVAVVVQPPGAGQIPGGGFFGRSGENPRRGSFGGNFHDPADAEGGMSHLLTDLEVALIGFGEDGLRRLVGHDVQHVAGHLREKLAGCSGAGKSADDPAGGLGKNEPLPGRRVMPTKQRRRSSSS